MGLVLVASNYELRTIVFVVDHWNFWCRIVEASVNDLAPKHDIFGHRSGQMNEATTDDPLMTTRTDHIDTKKLTIAWF